MPFHTIEDQVGRDNKFIFRNDGQQGKRDLTKGLTGPSSIRTKTPFSLAPEETPKGDPRFTVGAGTELRSDLEKIAPSVTGPFTFPPEGPIREVKPKTKKATTTGGTQRPVTKAVATAGRGLKSGEGRLSVIDPTTFVGPKTKAGRFTGGGGGFADIGTFKRGGAKKTLREEAQAKGVPADIFSEAGIKDLFGSTAELARLFSSKEFQARKAKGIRAGATAKGKQADVKAKSERIKALTGVLEQLPLDIEGETSTLRSKLEGELERLSLGGAASQGNPQIRLAARLKKSGLSDEEISDIIGSTQ